jgi:hypothetical protein
MRRRKPCDSPEEMANREKHRQRNESRKEYFKEYYKKNKKNYDKHGRNRRVKAREWLLEYKSSLECELCPENHPACLQFHHKDKTQKEFVISRAVCAGWSKETILTEIAKCSVLCGNCHAKLHFENNSRGK